MVDTELYKLYLRHWYTLITRLILSCVSFDNKIDLDELDNARADTHASYISFYGSGRAILKGGVVDGCLPYANLINNVLLCLQLTIPRCFISSRPTLAALPAANRPLAALPAANRLLLLR
jgi:hypothetical protein